MAGLALLLLWYVPQMHMLQAHDCHLAPEFSGYLDQVLPAGSTRTEVDDWLKWFHEVSASFIWMQQALVIGFLVNWEMGTEMYRLVVTGHIVKNFAKSFIQSPRGFWFCQTGEALYCGSGNTRKKLLGEEEIYED